MKSSIHQRLLKIFEKKCLHSQGDLEASIPQSRTNRYVNRCIDKGHRLDPQRRPRGHTARSTAAAQLPRKERLYSSSSSSSDGSRPKKSQFTSSSTRRRRRRRSRGKQTRGDREREEESSSSLSRSFCRRGELSIHGAREPRAAAPVRASAALFFMKTPEKSRGHCVRCF